MILPNEGFSVTVVINFQDNTLKLSKFRASGKKML